MSLAEDLATQLSQERYALNSLLEFARTLTPDLGPNGIVRSVMRTVMGKSLIKQAFAYLRTEENHYELVSHSGVSSEELPAVLDRLGFDRLTPKYHQTFTLMPLVSGDGADFLGMLVFGKSSNPNLHSESEATYRESLAALTAIALTNAWLFEREKERERLESELRLARDIQRSLLPQKLPELEGVEFAAVSRPSEWVGGDYYDVIQLGETSVLVCIADVVGKGVGAALTMSNLQAALRALVGLIRRGHLDLLGAVLELNHQMCESTSPDRFITAAFGILDVQRRKIECVVCGHPNPAIAIREGTVTEFESTGIPLGIIATFPYESRTYNLNNGTILLFYTDGLSEAKYGEGMVGVKGVEEVLQHPSFWEGDLNSALERLVSSPQITVEDDITVLAVRFK